MSVELREHGEREHNAIERAVGQELRAQAELVLIRVYLEVRRPPGRLNGRLETDWSIRAADAGGCAGSRPTC